MPACGRAFMPEEHIPNRLNYKPFFLPLPTPPFPPSPSSSLLILPLSTTHSEREREREEKLLFSLLLHFICWVSSHSLVAWFCMVSFFFVFLVRIWLCPGWFLLLTFLVNLGLLLQLLSCIVSVLVLILKVLFLCLPSCCKLELQDFWMLVNCFCWSLLSFPAWDAVDLHALCLC